MERKMERIKFAEPLLKQATRVAAYARVSCPKIEMLHSLAAQVSYYSSLIQGTKGWKYVGVYVDEAKTGTKDGRENFQRLLNDCRAGKIDMIITKSISRFARNTVTLLEAVRELKARGIDVFFEEQNLHTMSEQGEFVLTALAALAQEESRSVSENCKWRIRRKFQEGIPSCFALYGYNKENGEITINDEESLVVKEIFSHFLSGEGSVKIANYLREHNIPSPTGTIWRHKSVINILKNEKFMGDMLLQKSYITDHISKVKKKNNGVLPKYYVEDTHPAIVSKEDFAKAQEIFVNMNTEHSVARYDYDFKGKVFCGKCGWRYMRKKNHGRFVWKCGTFSMGGPEICRNKLIHDDVLCELANSCEKPIEKIIILPDNDVKFILSDGTETIKHWEVKSRSESWTEEMKALARAKTIERRKKVCSEQ